MIKIFQSLEKRDFRLYWFGVLISFTGTWIQIIAQGWLVFNLTNSEFLLGLIGFLSSIPVLFFSLPSGVIADQQDKRILLLYTQITLMVLAFALGFLTSSGLIKIWHVMVIVFLNGVAFSLDGPVRQSFVLELVGSEYLLNAIGLNSAAFHTARVVGPAIAGLIIGSTSIAACFYINGVSFLAVIAAILMMKRPPFVPPQTGEKENMLTRLKEVVDFIRKHESIGILVLLAGIQSLIVMPYTSFMPVFAKEVLHKGARGLGVLMASSGVGALLGALTVASVPKNIKKGMLVIFSFIIFSVFIILFSLSTNFWFSLGFLAVIGWGTVVSMASVNSIVQINSPDEMRGRIMSIFMLAFAGFMPFGNLLAGALSAAINVQRTFFLFGVVSLALALYIRFFKKEISLLD